jgi:carboxyl-terminal processing protease
MKPMIFRSVLILIFCSVLFISRGYSQQQKVDSLISQESKDYFDNAFKIIKNGSYKKKDIDFEELYQKALVYIKGAKAPQDTYEAIKFTLTLLKDKHSRFIYPKKNIILQNKEENRGFPLKPHFLNNEYAVLELFSYSSLNEAQNKKVADSIYKFILRLKEGNIKNLIIDLRKMEGGSNDPFLCGLAPLINHTKLFTLVGNDHQKESTVFEKGHLYKVVKKAKRGSIYLSNYIEDKAFLPSISILTGPYTASAGEIIAVAFKGLQNVKFVGAPTYGIPTGVALFTLKDGAGIGVATSIPFDRNGKSYTSSLNPDTLLEMKDLSDEEVYQKVMSINK